MTLDDDLPWDQARPKRDCLSIAVGRTLKSEIRKHQGVHTVTCFAYLSCFYDTVNLDSILAPAAELNYPPVHLKLALDLYSGPRLIRAEGIAGDPKYYSHGILQGCPQAPAISKLILYRLLKELQRAHPAVALQTWVDDVSYDVSGTDPDCVAREAILPYRSLKDLLTAAGLKVNADKTGFISSHRAGSSAPQCPPGLRGRCHSWTTPQDHPGQEEAAQGSRTGRYPTEIETAPQHWSPHPQKRHPPSDVVGGTGERTRPAKEAVHPCDGGSQSPIAAVWIR